MSTRPSHQLYCQPSLQPTASQAAPKVGFTDKAFPPFFLELQGHTGRKDMEVLHQACVHTL